MKLRFEKQKITNTLMGVRYFRWRVAPKKISTLYRFGRLFTKVAIFFGCHSRSLFKKCREMRAI